MNVITIIMLLCHIVTFDCIFAEDPDCNQYSPLIIIPGFAGSRLYFTSPSQPKPKLVWVNPIYIEETSLLTKYLRLKYNRTSHTTYSEYGFKYVTEGWGDTLTIEKLSEFPGLAYTDYHGMIKKVLKTKYYKRNVTLRGAPFDFRKAPNEMKSFFNQLRILIEETYKTNGNTRVVLLGHSLGTMFSLSFLKQMHDNWKKFYIKSFVAVSGPLGGAVKSLLMETTGKSVIFFKSPLLFREFERTFPSTVFLLPQAAYFKKQTLIQTSERKYTAESYRDLFHDLNQDDGYAMYNDVKNLVDGSKSPTGIDQLYCFHGAGIKTLESYFVANFNQSKPLFKYGQGDGTVNLVSLQICKSWTNVLYNVINGTNHKTILHNDLFIQRLMNILVNK